MNKPNRYICTKVLGMFEAHWDENGDYVLYKDYQKLESELSKVRSVSDDNKSECESTRIENSRLKNDVEYFKKCALRLNEQTPKLLWENEHLKADIENLSQKIKSMANAGDAMRDEISKHMIYNQALKVINGWHYSKEEKTND